MQDTTTILIADDDERVLKALMIRLGHVGFEVITATDGYSALALAAKHKPSLLVLDINMPAGDGFSVQERMKENPDLAATPVVYVTGDKSDRLDQIARRLGGFAVLHKPFHIEELIDTLMSALSLDRVTKQAS